MSKQTRQFPWLGAAPPSGPPKTNFSWHPVQVTGQPRTTNFLVRRARFVTCHVWCQDVANPAGTFARGLTLIAVLGTWRDCYAYRSSWAWCFHYPRPMAYVVIAMTSLWSHPISSALLPPGLTRSLI